MSEKINRVSEDARAYLAEKDIETVNEERDQADETRLGRVGEIIEVETMQGGQKVTVNSSRE